MKPCAQCVGTERKETKMSKQFVIIEAMRDALEREVSELLGVEAQDTSVYIKIHRTPRKLAAAALENGYHFDCGTTAKWVTNDCKARRTGDITLFLR